MKVIIERNQREDQVAEELWKKKYGIRTPDMCPINHVLQLGNYTLCVNINGEVYVGFYAPVHKDYITLDEPTLSCVLVTNEHTYIVVFNNNKEVKSFKIVK